MNQELEHEKVRILVVEDEGLIALDLSNKLKEMGFEVPGLARSGKEAIEKVGELSPDLVLMDIRLEGPMDGIEAATEIGNRFGTPVIFLTAYADGETLNRAKVTEPYGYMVKPVTERELRIVTAIALHKNRAQTLIRTKVRQQAAVADFSQLALKGESLEALFERAVQVVTGGLGVEFAKVLEIQPDGTMFRLKAGVGWREGLVGKTMIPLAENSLGGITLALKHPVIVNDLRTDARFSSPSLLSDHGVVSGISVIIHGPKAPIGILGAHSSKKRTFNEDDIHFIQSIANVLSLALERRFAEEAAKRLASIVETSDAAIVGCALDGTVLSWNRGAERIYGYKSEEIVGDSISRLSPNENVNEVSELLEQVKLGKSVDHFDTAWARKDGTKIHVSLTVSPIIEITGNIAGASAISRDISGEKAAEEAEKKRNEEIARIKDDFFASVSHELRTPLTLILAPLETLLAKRPETHFEGVQLLKTMHNNAMRLLQIVTGLLDYSKLEAGKVEVRREPTDVVTLTRSIVNDFEPLMKSKGLRFQVQTEGEHLVVSLDRYLFERMLFNLLSNAIKFTDSDGQIVIRLRRLDEDRIELAVQDTGIGISDEDQRHLFERFHQTQHAFSKRFEGTGIGLALVKDFAELSGGKTWVQSKVGEGSTFFIDISAPVTAALPRDEFKSKRLSLSTVHLPTNNEGREALAEEASLPTILVAEDNMELAQYISSLLGNSCHVHIACDGEKASEMARAVMPDLILADIMMPKLDGIELCKRLKHDPRTASIPFVLVTALTNRDSLLRGWDAGADEYLFKPFHPQELVTRIRSLLAMVQDRKQRSDEKKRREELEEFAHFASHDLREPLRQITNFAQLLKKSGAVAAGVSVDKTLGFIVDGAKRMQDLIDGLVDYSKLTGKDVSDEKVSCDIALSDALKISEAQIHETGAMISFGTLPSVIGKHMLLVQLFQNLVSNALKYRNPDRTPQIEIQSEKIGDEWIFSVRDNGIGFDERYAEHIFVMFKRLHQPHQYSGSGLGLAICKRIVQRLNGRIWAESKQGVGSVFRFTLPALVALEHRNSTHEKVAPSP